jgi:hypothetical protein
MTVFEHNSDVLQVTPSVCTDLFLVSGEMANRFLNENSREAFKTYKHLPEEAFGILFRDLSNNVYRKFSFKELFPE